MSQNDDRRDDTPQSGPRGWIRSPHVYDGPLPDLSQCKLYDRCTLRDDKLAEVVAASPTPPAWRDAWLYSTRGRGFTDPPDAQASPEERLAVWQAVRASGAIPEDAGFFLVAG